MKKIITSLAALIAAALMTAALPAAAETIGRNEYGIPQAVETDRLYHTDYTGVYLMFKDNCYIVEKSITLKHSVTLPRNSMLLVRDGAVLKVPDGITLTVKGAMLVHNKAKVNVMNGGSLVVRDTSTSVVNGTLAVSKGGSAEIGGYIQGGTVNVKGKLTVDDGGTLIYSRRTIYPSAEVSGELTRAQGIPEYMILELEETEGKLARYTDKKSGESAMSEEGMNLCREFEPVLYKYSGEMELPEGMELDEYLEMLEYDCTVEFETESGTIKLGSNSWNGIPIIDSAEGELKGRFYSAVMGNKPDVSYNDIFPYWGFDDWEDHVCVKNLEFRGDVYEWAPEAGVVSAYFIDEDKNVTTLEGDYLRRVDDDLDAVMQQFKKLEYLGELGTVDLNEIYINDGQVYRCGRDKILIVWNPPVEFQNYEVLRDKEYDPSLMYEVTMFRKVQPTSEVSS